MSEVARIHTPPDGVEERREVDPQRIVLTLQEHGARALNRFVGSNVSDFKVTMARDFTEGDNMRDIIKKLLEQREIRGPVNIKKFVGKHFEAAKALNVVKEGDKPCPSVEDAVRSFADLKLEELADINQMRKPVFQLLPITPSEQSKQIDMRQIRRQINAYVTLWIKRTLEMTDVHELRYTDSEETIVGWNIAITEGSSAPDVLEGDDVSKNRGDRLAWFQTAHPNRGIDLRRYMKIQQAGLTEALRPVDDFWRQDMTLTMLNGEPIHNGCVVCGFFDDYNSQLIINYNCVLYPNTHARFRLSVMRRCA